MKLTLLNIFVLFSLKQALNIGDGVAILNWEVNNEDVIFRVQINHLGWFTIGYGPNSEGFDAVLLDINEDNQVTITDLWTSGNSKPIKDIHQDYTLLEYKITENFYSVVYSRLLDTQDPYDQMLVVESNYTWIYGYGIQRNILQNLSSYQIDGQFEIQFTENSDINQKQMTLQTQGNQTQNQGSLIQKQANDTQIQQNSNININSQNQDKQIIQKTSQQQQNLTQNFNTSIKNSTNPVNKFISQSVIQSAIKQLNSSNLNLTNLNQSALSTLIKNSSNAQRQQIMNSIAKEQLQINNTLVKLQASIKNASLAAKKLENLTQITSSFKNLFGFLNAGILQKFAAICLYSILIVLI